MFFFFCTTINKRFFFYFCTSVNNLWTTLLLFEWSFLSSIFAKSDILLRSTSFLFLTKYVLPFRTEFRAIVSNVKVEEVVCKNYWNFVEFSPAAFPFVHSRPACRIFNRITLKIVETEHWRNFPSDVKSYVFKKWG